MRPLEDIEQTRLRRNWEPYYGAEGAALIYNEMSAALKHHPYPTMTIDYRDLLASPTVHASNIARFAGLDLSAAELQHAVDFVRKPDAIPPAFNEMRRQMEAIFVHAYENNAWGGRQSRSGIGSELEQTRTLIAELPNLFRSLGNPTVLDIPCGDFHWMKQVDLSGIDYVGADIVAPIIEHNRDVQRAPNISFRILDLTSDPLPKVDLICAGIVLSTYLTTTYSVHFEILKQVVRPICWLQRS